MGTLLRVVVHAADIQDRDGAKGVLDLVQRGHCRLDSVLYVGGRYRACLFEHMAPPRFPQAPPRYE